MANFIEDFYNFTLDLESPDAYIQWSSYGTLAAIMRDSYYWVDANNKRKIYPNIYIVLYGRSSALRKTAPLDVAESLIREVDSTKFFSGRFSIEASIKRMAEVYTNSRMEKIVGGSCCMYSEEIASLFASPETATKILTDLYDYHEKWDNDILKNEGIQSINNVCLNLLTASNDILFKEVFTSSSLAGGLLRRIFIVTADRKRHHTSPFEPITVDQFLRKRLVSHLTCLSKQKGIIIFDEYAKREFNEWYLSMEEAHYADESGVISSLHTSAQKLAMIFAAAEYNFDFIVSRQHMEKAIDEVQKMAKNYKIIAPFGNSALTTKKNSELGAEILKILLKQKDNIISRKALIRRVFQICNDIREFDTTVDYLIASEWIKMDRLGDGEMGFRLIPEKLANDAKKKEEELKKGKK